MRGITLYGIALLSAVILLSGCQSSLRFTSDLFPGKVKAAIKPAPGNAITGSRKDNTIQQERNIPETGYARDIIDEAEKWIGTPYVYGGNSRSGIDCSGFVQQIYAAKGIYLPRTASQQYFFTDRISMDELIPGDLVFFKNSSKISHVGIYAGGGLMIHASSSLGVARQTLDDSWFRQHLAGAGRVSSLSLNCIPGFIYY
ncbi:MAG: C40 family peptidase [Candidatus Kapaibacterium sp.]